MHTTKKLLLTLLLAFIGIQHAIAQFTIADQNRVASIVYDIENSALDSIAAHLLARDIEAVTHKRPEIFTSLEEVEGNVIIIGDVTSQLIGRYLDTSQLNGGWEMYGRIFKKALTKKIDQAMVIVGSDPRGAAYGVFDLSKQIGVSPWYWWADVPIEHKNNLIVDDVDTFSNSPTVKFRGIFINDEGWGLEPWASKTFEPSVGNLGPKTYAKIFELLLRLKGNAIWPGMHPNTRPFFTVPGNAETADKWGIVAGSSHSESMLRNNVGEWNSRTMGDFNYSNNATSVYNYWEQRVKESKGVNAIYSMGMRGVHDSGMQGFGSTDEKVKALETIVSDQRELLRKYINDDVTQVPQSFVAYKEVLKIYESGLKLPEDITIIWPDDNHGYIKHFSSKDEQLRSGGAGVYYHLSYLGAPHPYIWLSPMTPALVWREMTRASLQHMNNIWIANVGDIKRREWSMEFFMNMAWDINSWKPENIKNFFEKVATRDISGKHSPEIANMIWEYYRLANERKPEFMGFNAPQWNGWPPVQDPLYSLWNYNDEVDKRLIRYQKLQAKAQQIMQEIPQKAKDTYFQLVYYPIAAATAMNEKLLYAYKSREYAKQGRTVANAMSDSAFAAFDKIKQLTHHYNHEIANGKWEHMVDYSPSYKKGSLVFWEPISKRIETDGLKGLGVAIEGQAQPAKPTRGSQPNITTRDSKISLSASEAKISGEMVRGKDSDGEFISWPDNGTNRQIQEPHWDEIPFEIGSPTKAMFEFNLEDQPGGVHKLNLSVGHPEEGSDLWWVTLNDRPPFKSSIVAGGLQQLQVQDFVLKPGLNKLTLHPCVDGTKLYGVDFIQEGQSEVVRYATENRLPIFNRAAGQKHFIDIYSRGRETEKWSAKTSAPWIQLSEEAGELNEDQDRIWVTINYDKAPSKKELKGHVNITNGEQFYQVAVSAVNHQLDLEPGVFVEQDGVITMPASQFNQNQEGKVASWNILTGLGRSGSAMLLQPLNGWYIEDLSQVQKQSPALEYEIVVTHGGQAEIIVEAVPGFPIKFSQPLRCAVSIDEEEPQWINFDMKGEPWDNNVLETRMIGTGGLDLKPGAYRLKVWGTDPSVNVDRILIDFGGLKQSYTGPHSSKIMEK
ncbi:glycosyl hydrolase 115 family protein [Pseudozobellia sp. WGM2]|uniref:glycosyl hydrolase 115 family protein n=1 Tax=Pseudozobellia sp. WGM2 TaxID=2787625 RepID=UPI001AE0406F|nr:glycosyl hydrolase 115 family protein [Pseudozobellia sp. WGM2]